MEVRALVPVRFAALAGGLLLVASGCSSSEQPSLPRAAAAASAPSPVPKTLQIEGVTYLDYGTMDVSAKTVQRVRQYDSYFTPTFLHAEAGKAIHLRVKNEGSEVHNFSIPELGIDQDIPPNTPRVEIPVTFPADGTLRFFCKLHADQGMNGQLRIGPPAPSASPAVPSPSPTPLS